MLFKSQRNKHQQYLIQLPKISQSVVGFSTLFSPLDFRSRLLEKISSATYRIYILALYLENDEGGQEIFSALYAAKKQKPNLDICVLVDWHRAKRCRIGTHVGMTNADWYYLMANKNPNDSVPVYGIPVHNREAWGVFHLKGSIIDDTVLYSGASFNNAYLHQKDTYRYDRYQCLNNRVLADTMLQWIQKNLLKDKAVHRIDQGNCSSRSDIKNCTRKLRRALRQCHYQFQSNGQYEALSITPLLGLGKHSALNKAIHHFMLSTQYVLMICTPYFNLPAILARNILFLLRQGKIIEIIVGDKTANDFYTPRDQPFTLIGVLPYLYEINLRSFLSRLQNYINIGQLIVRVWMHGKNSYHLKGLWVDDEWMMLTGSNLNPRSWRLDLENAILVHDPLQQLAQQRFNELKVIRQHTVFIKNYQDLESISDYPKPVRKCIRRLRSMHIDQLILRLL
ncbi:CDP-diacylglycerol--serine O-phosphatidyltransferase [Candidatus Erwinia haradaeae]|uniref:CDP-diacylglycerol--serine O-phosphatidyltransferase n=1 Tax=Candidatus Erwinia haradaeae TaxID=1922217 RepID=A0A451D4I5_9GAMM|nr:CDP-diacylglycerol--serine O-phosphatidyltransferase [Candidatus Erwinia haradaeae]VFP80576.1 CDP-diacylglycerol--serine O-phosphatidyltransferase [Candidatus Erwinia haradaeae]